MPTLRWETDASWVTPGFFQPFNDNGSAISNAVFVTFTRNFTLLAGGGAPLLPSLTGGPAPVLPSLAGGPVLPRSVDYPVLQPSPNSITIDPYSSSAAYPIRQ
jgi:hypothetical protein